MSNTATNYPYESLLVGWSKSPSDSEDQRCTNAERVVKGILDKSSAMHGLNYSVFAQGSYKNGTNVKKESDVDLCVLSDDSCIYQYNNLPGIDHSSQGVGPPPYSHTDFKNSVGRALASALGNEVTRGNKAFDIKSNTYRVSSDVVPCLPYIEYKVDQNGQIYRRNGTYILADDGEEILNWPHHHYANGVAKNKGSSMRFKPLVRTLKNVRNAMIDDNWPSAKPIASFLIESLTWNLPLSSFGFESMSERVYAALTTFRDISESNWTTSAYFEVNGIKGLFWLTQPWTSAQVVRFASDALKYLEFED